MPEVQDLRVVVGETGESGPMLNDVMTIGKYTGRVVKIENKETWAYITLKVAAFDKIGTTPTGRRQKVHVTAGNVRRKLPMDSEVNVMREVETYEERLLRERDKITEEAKASIFMSDKLLADRLEKLASDFSLDRAATVQEVKAMNFLWATVEMNANWLIEKKGVDEEWAYIPAVMNVMEVCRSKLINRYTHRALSRSTSVISNLIEDIDKDVAAQFIDEWRYRHLTEVHALYLATTEDEEVL